MHNLGSLACLLLALADPPPSGPPAGSALEVVAALESALADAIAKAEPSVVAIARKKGEDDVTTAVKGRNDHPGAVVGVPDGPMDLNMRGRVPLGPDEEFGADQISFDFGSGVVIGDHGEILTAFHVVRGAKRLHVRAMGKQSFDAVIIAADPRSDLAVIVPKAGTGITPPRLTPLPLGDASKLRKGSFLVALGNPFNAAGQDGRPSAAWGILSNVARRLEPSQDATSLALKNYPTLLQLDAKLNLGMSGGAVINLKGELVGLTSNSANAAGFDAQAGYAIPMDAMGRRAVETLKKGKEVEYGFLGVGLDRENLSNIVKSAQPGTPAAEGELHANDAILSVGDIPVNDMDGLFLAINYFTPGSRVILKLLRQDQSLERTVELAKAPVEGEIIATNRPSPWRGIHIDYTSTMPQANFAVNVLEAMARGGVAITEVDPDSPAEKAGLKKGQVIKSVEGRNIRNPREFLSAVAKMSGPARLDTDHGPFSVK